MSGQRNLTLQELSVGNGAEWAAEGVGILFLFVRQGRGRYVTSRLQQVVAPGDVLVVDAALPGRLSAVGREDLVAAYFHIGLEPLVTLFTALEMCQSENLKARLASQLFHPATAPLSRACHALVATTPPHASLEHRCHLLKIVSLLFSEFFQVDASQKLQEDPSHAGMMTMLERMDSADLQNLSVEELASRLGCGRRHLNRLFQEYFGTSVATLKMEMRLLKAASLLRDPSAKVINVAMESGFNHLGLFSTCFKRRFGATPSEWRRQDLAWRMASQTGAADRGGAKEICDVDCHFRHRGLCPWETGHPKVVEPASEASGRIR